MRRRLWSEIEQTNPADFAGKKVAYDGMANAYVTGGLPKESLTITIEYAASGSSKDPRSFKLSMRRVCSVNVRMLSHFLSGKDADRSQVAPYEVITALEVIMRHQLCQKNVVAGRSIYDGRTVIQIPGAVDVWRGVFLSLRPSLGRMLLNADTSATAFLGSGPVVSLIRDILKVPKADWARFDTIGARDRGVVERHLSMCRVEVTHRGDARRRYKCLGLSAEGPAKTFFEDQDGKKQSVLDYFVEKYQITLKYPNMPCLAVGSPRRPVLLPMEVCEIPAGQRYMRQLSGDQTSEMIRIANRQPAERLELLRTAARNAMSGETAAFMSAFGLKTGGELVQVHGRRLSPPTIFYGSKSREASIQPSQGAWNLRDKCVEIGATANSWAVLVFGSGLAPPDVQSFVRELVATCSDTGMAMAQRQPPILFAKSQNAEAELKAAYGKAAQVSGRPAQFVLCILPTDDAGLYGDIKLVTDTMLGLPSQCMLMKHVRKASKQYCANLCLKINAKLGGVNSSLGKQIAFVCEKPTMILGADVTHPGVGEDDKPSIAALVGSMDIKLGRYAASVRVQGSRVEIISEMKAMFVEQLTHFAAANKTKPQRILFYRDGVSEGQFTQVLNHELNAIKEACREISASSGTAYNPTVTIVIVGKRHHTRFFATDPRDADRSGNTIAGTVVDSGIVHPSQFDFYLCSHAGLQGTSRPAHYHVVHDENGFTADSLQAISYNLCYTFARCTRSVSVVTPAYYAHLVAFRARFHFSRGSGFCPVKAELAPHMYFI